MQEESVSDAPDNVSDETQVENQDDIQTQNDDEQIIEEQQVSRDYAKRLLAQKKKFQSESEKLRRENEKLRQNQLEREGKKDELIQELKSSYQTEKEARQQERAEYAYEVLSGSVKAKAAELGCIDLESLMFHIDVETLQPDEGFKPDDSALTDQLADIKRRKPHLFRKSAPKIHDGTPATPDVTKSGPDLSKMTIRERAMMLAQMKADAKNKR